MRVFGIAIGAVLLRATFLAVAPVAPVTWRPATRGIPAQRRVARMPGTGARVVAIPVGPGPLEARAIDLPRPLSEATLRAPWGEPATPFTGVTVTTARVPEAWLRPPARPIATIIPIRPSQVIAPALTTPAHPPVPATIVHLPRAPRAVPPAPAAGTHRPRGRLRGGLTLAVGLIVSLVAVEVAARSGRR